MGLMTPREAWLRRRVEDAKRELNRAKGLGKKARKARRLNQLYAQLMSELISRE